MCAQGDEAESVLSKYDSTLRESLRHASSAEIADTFDAVEPGEPESGTLPRECPPASAPGSTLEAENEKARLEARLANTQPYIRLAQELAISRTALQAQRAQMRGALKAAMDWAAGFPLGGLSGDLSPDRSAAWTVYEMCKAALSTDERSELTQHAVAPVPLGPKGGGSTLDSVLQKDREVRK